MNQMDAITALTTTRAVRKRLDVTRPVPRDVVDDCVEIAAQAPQGGNRQRLRWVFVEDAPLRSEVVSAFRETGLATYRTMLERASTPSSRRAYAGAIELLERLETIPLLAIPCMIGAPREPFDHSSAAAFYGSAFPAIWSFQVALRTHGLGSTLTTVHLQKEREVAELLGIPEKVRQLALLPIAYTIGQDFKRAKRAPAAEIVSYDGWASAPAE